MPTPTLSSTTGTVSVSSRRVEADDRLGVADVDDQQHGQPLPRLARPVVGPVPRRGPDRGRAPGRARGPSGSARRPRSGPDPPRRRRRWWPASRRPTPRSGSARSRPGGPPRSPRRPSRGPCCRAARRRPRPGRPRPPARGRRTRSRPSGPATALRARRTASVMLIPARWLSFTSTASERLDRWLVPPPARTAAFSSTRSPGVVLRVSSTATDGLRSCAAATYCAVSVATPERWPEEVERRALGGEDRPQRPGDLQHGVAGRQLVAVVGVPVRARARGRPAGRSRSRSPGRPARRAGGPAARSARSRRLGHQRGREVALGPRSSARARSTASRPPARTRSSDVRRLAHAHGRPDVAGPAPAPWTSRRRQAGRSSGYSRRGVGAPALGAGERRGQQRVGQLQQVGQLAGADRRRRCRPSTAVVSSTTARAPGERLGAAHDAGPAGHGPLQRVAQLGHVDAAAEPIRRPAPRPAAAGGSHARCTRCRRAGSRAEHGPQGAARLGPGGARRDALGQAGAEDHPLEQRVGGQPVGPVHAGAGHLAHRPQPGQRRGAPQVGDHAAGEVVGGRGDGEPVALGVEPDGRPARRRWSGSARRSARARWRRARGGRRPARPCGPPWPGSPRRAAPARRRSARRRGRAAARRGRAAPRRAAGRGMAGWCSAVGWNCTNSTSAVGTPARSAMATPSPVDSGGLVVTEKSWPAPPVASTTWSARTSTGPSPPTRAAAPARPTQRPPSTRRSRANHPSSTALAER